MAQEVQLFLRAAQCLTIAPSEISFVQYSSIIKRFPKPNKPHLHHTFVLGLCCWQETLLAIALHLLFFHCVKLGKLVNIFYILFI